ncbi:hypothetical protein ASG12_14210 [Williamsia sp. Leaf354]|jgi:hypothetical protein|uniref:hypothetical protein n=1 Tax=Williamsia sp. Leaf354 TaxID=1736349 RepID=UPI0006F46BA7|nr:hypothetical protein [Williamsia sp. Leaf354]KQR98108.1 hypothetical protein ASG12_14210 [Williamsia sp. Leaf354]
MDAIATARRAMDSVRTDLVGTTHGRVTVDSVLHYGAVDLDPDNLVVWVLLTGLDDEELPEWLTLTLDRWDVWQSAAVDRTWLAQVRDAVITKFQALDWPNARAMMINVDSARRVGMNGGWNYFRG